MTKRNTYGRFPSMLLVVVVGDILCHLATAFLPISFSPLKTGINVIVHPSTTGTTFPSPSYLFSSRPVDEIRYKPSLLDEDRGPDGVPEYDTIIIGSGIGGLATASLLSKGGEEDGHKVLVVEQHPTKCGGCLQCFERKGFKFGTGLHYVGEVGADDDSKTGLSFKEMLHAVTCNEDAPDDTSRDVEWTPLPHQYDTITIGRDKESERESERVYKVYACEWKEKLKEQFPEEHEAIDKYFDLIDKAIPALHRGGMFKSIPLPIVKFMRWTGLTRLLDRGYHKLSRISLRDQVNKLTKNQDLRTVLTYNCIDYGSLPSDTPFIWHAMLTTHYSQGAYYPTGGPDTIAKKIISAIQERGGKVLANAPVMKVLLDDGKAVGVYLEDGTFIRAKQAVVSDAGVFNTCHYLLPPSTERTALLKRFKIESSAFTKASRKKGDGVLPSLSGLNLFIGLEGDHDEDLHLPHDHLFLFPSSRMESDLKHLPERPEPGLANVSPRDFVPIFIGSPSAKDSSWKKNHPKKSTLEILTFIPYTWFEKYAPKMTSKDGVSDPGGKPGSHGEEYKRLKKDIAEKIWVRVREALVERGASDKRLPRSLNGAGAYELGTPLTFAHYLRGAKGAWYGLNHDIARFRMRYYTENLRPEIPEIKGLYLTGQDVTDAGVIGALGGAFMCSAKILGHKSFHPLLNLDQKKDDDEPALVDPESLILA